MCVTFRSDRAKALIGVSSNILPATAMNYRLIGIFSVDSWFTAADWILWVEYAAPESYLNGRIILLHHCGSLLCYHCCCHYRQHQQQWTNVNNIRWQNCGPEASGTPDQCIRIIYSSRWLGCMMPLIMCLLQRHIVHGSIDCDRKN